MKLHQRWCEAGFDPDAFWDQTPRTVRSALAGHRDRVSREQRTLLTMAWHNARWSSFTQTLESLADVLRRAEGREEDPDIAWQRMEIWANAYGQAIEIV